MTRNKNVKKRKVYITENCIYENFNKWNNILFDNLYNKHNKNIAFYPVE